MTKYRDITLIAHRGYQRLYPENTLLAFQKAREFGIRHIELDIQLTADHEAVVYHDDSLARTSGEVGYVYTTPLTEMREKSAHEAARLGDTFRGTKVSTLGEVCQWLKSQAQTTLFVEVKPEILNHVDVDVIASRVVSALDGLSEQCVIISFAETIVRAFSALKMRTGFIITHWQQVEDGLISSLSPEFVFCNHTKIPVTFRFPDHPKWALYEIPDLSTLDRFYQQGCRYFESFRAPELGRELDLPTQQ